MQDPSLIAPGLMLGDDDIWRARRQSAIDYPDQANAFCFQIEEHSLVQLPQSLYRRFRP